MPIREEPLVTGNVYHIFNKTIDHREIFKNPSFCEKFLSTLIYYRSIRTSLCYADYLHLKSIIKKNEILEEINYAKYFQISIFAYCLMPNHYHLIVKQLKENGIKSFLAHSIDSMTRYYNNLNDRNGPLFISRFKAVHIRNDEQLMQTSKYIHLNPYAGKVVDSLFEVLHYPWSSLSYYLSKNEKNNFINKINILKLFDNNSDRYLQFLLKTDLNNQI